jgi:hypothetical protein
MPADLEIGGAVRAGQARWHRTARTTTLADGDAETEEIAEREPTDPERGRPYRHVRLAWQLHAWLTNAIRR